jgi:hypothetical protein
MKMISMIATVVINDGFEGQSQTSIYASQQRFFYSIAKIVHDCLSQPRRGSAEQRPSEASDVQSIAEGMIAERIRSSNASAEKRSERQESLEWQPKSNHIPHESG